MDFHGSATAHIDAPPETVFDVITDIDRLPQWNAAVESVVETPPALDDGAQWVVVIHPRRIPSWHSRATLLQLDRESLQFAYRSQTDDGNPTYGDWHWTVVPSGDGCELTVQWEFYPKTLGRKLFAARIRSRQLTREVEASIEGIGPYLRNDEAETPRRPAG